MKPSSLLFFFLLLALVVTYANALSAPPPSNNYEQSFLNIPEAARCAEHLAVYTSTAHVAGTDGDYETVLYTVQQFESFGFDAEIVPFTSLVTYPISSSLKLVAPFEFTASLKEDYIPIDPVTGDSRATPTFNAYSASGSVSAPVVYVNYGQIEDYEALKAIGAPLEGAIHIARYGQIFRGTKVMLAQMYGAVGMLIYSDPADDGYVLGPVYPNGPWRPESGVQRGSTEFLSICPGDPSRPVCNNSALPSIPVQPISWGDAYPFLSSLGGPVAPESFQGGLNFTYHIGPGNVVANFSVVANATTATLWNVIVKIEGSTNPDEIIMLGNHRDAWVFGAVDPNSGTAVLLELARGYAELMKMGWQPSRTIILASWDGEEYGLLGSTNYAETNQELFSEQLIAYLNVDTAVAGIPYLMAGGTPSMADFVYNASASVIDPNSGLPLSQVWNFSFPLLGSGSDFTAYLDYLGVPSMDLSFYGDYGVYHSVYDSFHWMSTEGDPTFVYHRAMVQFWGLLGIRFASALVLPFNYVTYGQTLVSLVSTTQELLNGTNYYLDLTDLQEATSAFLVAASNLNLQTSNVTGLNYILGHLEREFLGPGLPGRPFYRHVIQAPGLYLGYGADPYPGVSQAIRDQDWTQAQEQLNILVERIAAATALLLQPLH